MLRVDEIASQEMQNVLNAFQSSATDRIKLESFGIFLQDYVISGGVVTATGSLKVKVSEAIISLVDFLWKVYETNLNIPGANGTYYIDFDPENRKFICTSTHPTYYKELAQVTVSNGTITKITDTRGEVGGIRFNEDVAGIVANLIAVGTDQILNGAVTNIKMAINAIANSNIQNDAVTELKIKDDSMSTNKLKNKSVTNEKLADDSVDSNKLADNSVGTEHLQDGKVTGTKIADEAIDTPKIQPKAVTTDRLATGAVTGEKIANYTLDSKKFMPGMAFPESMLNLNYPTAWLYEVLTALQGGSTGNLVELVAARQGYNTLSEKLDSMETTIFSQSFVATEGQTHFTLTAGQYQPGTNTLFVTIGGIPQDVTSGLTEINSTSFSIDEPLKAGTDVYVWGYNKVQIPTTYHARGHKAGGGDSIDLGELSHNLPVVIDGGEW